MIIRKVRSVMTADLVTVTEDAPFVELVRLLAVHRVSALPVVNREGRVIGIDGGAPDPGGSRGGRRRQPAHLCAGR